MGGSESRDQADGPISAVLTDVDGTLVTKDKVLTEHAIAAVKRLHERGIVFLMAVITSKSAALSAT